MLRRRHKTPKPGSKREAAAPREGVTARTVRSRRRAREGAPVPAELKIGARQKAPPEKPQAKPPQPKSQEQSSQKPHEKPAQARQQEKPAQPRPPQARPPQPKPQEALPSREKAAPPREPAAAPPEDVVLVTGFEPFGGDQSNPSWDVCTRLPREIAGLRVEVCRVPCEFRRAIEVVAAAIERHRPSLVLSLGLASGRTHMGVERVAINVDDARIPDNGGVQPVDQPIAANGPPAYFATLPVKAMVAEMHARGVPAEVSNTAGTFVCNHLMYGVLHFIAAQHLPARAGFIHVPRAEGQSLAERAVPTMSLATMARGVEAAIAAAQAHSEDIAAAGGSLD